MSKNLQFDKSVMGNAGDAAEQMGKSINSAKIEVQYKPLSRLSIYNPDDTPIDYEEILENLRLNPIRTPLIVEKMGNETLVIDGKKRLLAAKQLVKEHEDYALTFTMIPVVFSKFTDDKERNDAAFPKDMANVVGSVSRLKVSNIIPDPNQPRRDFNEEKLEELKASIVSSGLIQPIIVERIADNQYQIIAGERRWRAHKLAALPTIDAIVKDPLKSLTEKEILQYVENANREGLSPFEEAKALTKIRDRENFSIRDLAEKTGKSKSRVGALLSIEPIEWLVNQEASRRRDAGEEEQEVSRRRDSLSIGLLEELATIKDKPFFNKALSQAFGGISRAKLRDLIKKESENSQKTSKKEKGEFKTQLVSAMGEEERKHVKSTNLAWNDAEKFLIKNESISNEISDLEFELWFETEDSIMREHLDLLQRKLNIAAKIKASNTATPPKFQQMMEKIQNLIAAYRYIDRNIEYLIDSQSDSKPKSTKGSKKGSTPPPFDLADAKDLTPRHIAFYDHINEQFAKFEGNFIDDLTFQGLANELPIEVLEEQFELLPYRQGSKKPAGVFVTNCNKLIKGQTVNPPRTKVPNKHFREIEPFNFEEVRTKQTQKQAEADFLRDDLHFAKPLKEAFYGLEHYFKELKTSTEEDLKLFLFATDHRDLAESEFPLESLQATYQETVPNGTVQIVSLEELSS